MAPCREPPHETTALMIHAENELYYLATAVTLTIFCVSHYVIQLIWYIHSTWWALFNRGNSLMCGSFFAKDGNNLLARGQILSTESNGKVDTHTEREWTQGHVNRRHYGFIQSLFSQEYAWAWANYPCKRSVKQETCDTTAVRNGVCLQRLLAVYCVSCWFSSSLSPGHLINGPAGGIPGRVIWDYIIKSHCQGFPTSCELFTPGKSLWVDSANTLIDEAVKSVLKRTDQNFFPAMPQGINNLPSEWTIT